MIGHYLLELRADLMIGHYLLELRADLMIGHYPSVPLKQPWD